MSALGHERHLCRSRQSGKPDYCSSILAEWPVALDAPTLEQKLVRDGRGGYCYEHNLLFSRVLKTLGFKVRELAGRVVWRFAKDALTPRTHVVLHIEIDGQ